MIEKQQTKNDKVEKKEQNKRFEKKNVKKIEIIQKQTYKKTRKK